MAGAGAGGAGDDVQLLGGHGRADQDHGADALHRVVDARRDLQVPSGDLRARVGQRLAAIQGGLLLAQVQHDPRPLETAVDTLLALVARK